jgi:hypothetical protein
MTVKTINTCVVVFIVFCVAVVISGTLFLTGTRWILAAQAAGFL